MIYSMVGKHDQAVATAQKAVALDPNSANTYAMLGHTLRMADRPEEAIPAYKKAIRLNPIPPTFYLFGLGMSYSLAGQHEKGIEWCEKAETGVLLCNLQNEWLMKTNPV